MSNDKIWDKALSHYQKAEYDDALKLCKTLLKKTPNDLVVLNMVSYIMFLKGDLESAKHYWNRGIHNGCTESKKYINNINEYERLIKLFIEALDDIKKNKITIAIDKLLLCQESDFNRILVGELLEHCLLATRGIKIQREYVDSLVDRYTNESTPKNLENSFNIKLIKKVNKISTENMNISPRQIKASILAVASIIICIMIYNVFNSFEFTAFAAKNDSDISEQPNNSVILNNHEYAESNTDTAESKDQDKTIETTDNTSIQSEKFTLDTFEHDIEVAISSKNMDTLYTILTSFSKDEIPSEKLPFYENAEKYMQDEGVNYFYKLAHNSFNNKDFTSAITQFSKAFTYSSGSYLEPHILYFLGLSYEITKNNTEAIKYFEMYANKYTNSDYSAECLYKLVLLFKDSDKDSAKKYANVIEANFSKSIYYNKIVKNVLYGS